MSPAARQIPALAGFIGAAFVAFTAQGAVLLRKRPPSGLLGGMTEVPTTSWTARLDGDTTAAGAPFPAAWRPCGTVGHVFTHFELALEVFAAEIPFGAAPAGLFWSQPGQIATEALPSVMISHLASFRKTCALASDSLIPCRAASLSTCEN